MSLKYVNNVYAWFQRKGLSDKYQRAGIYCIKVDENIVYIGKSKNMLWRVASHYVGIQTESEKKYRILAEAKRKGHQIGFDVLYYAKCSCRRDIDEEIGNKEGEYIRKYVPILNTQIPNKKDWHKYNTNNVDAKKVLKELIK